MVITFSGIDGSGKTTYAEAVANALRRRGLPAEVGRPRYLTCKSIEAFCLAEFASMTSFVVRLDPQVYLHALLADWLDHHTRTLRHHGDKIVVSDRYVYDVLAQLLHYHMEPTAFLRLVHYFPIPHRSYFLKISPEEARRRIERRGEPERDLESLENLHVLDGAYGRVRALLSWSPIEIGSSFEFDTIVDGVADAWSAPRGADARGAGE